MSAGAAGESPENGSPYNGTEQVQRKYLHYVGEEVTAMLKPYGVSVDVEICENGSDSLRTERKNHGKGAKVKVAWNYFIADPV